MSATATAPKPAATAGAVERVRAWLSPLNLHLAGVGLLALVNLYLLVHMAFLWRAASSHNTAALEQQQIALKTADIAARPLRGLDAKLALSTAEADTFYKQRLPGSDSEMLTELGVLTRKQGVRLIRVQYTPAPVLPGSPYELTELRMDASLSGDYRPLMEFINSLERDKMFFVINGISLTGQQSGMVNLRLRLTTYLQPGGTLNMTAGGGAAAAAIPTAATTGGSGR